MATKERLKKFVPDIDVPRDLYLEELHDHEHGVRMVFQGEEESGPFLVVEFKDVFSYRCTDDDICLRSFEEWKERERWPFFIVENSRYVAWFHEENLGLHEGVVHYLFLTGYRMVEVLSYNPPSMRWKKD